tara:strand:+ start:120 stop:560 length:441 start_codon:yes stop_codon:yes gene_type:complete
LRTPFDLEEAKNLNLMDAAKLQARKNLKGKGELLAPIRIWWTRKYRKSPKSVEFTQYTLLEIITEFWEDYYTDNPKEALRDGDRIITGDPLIDKWEKELEKGLDVDLSEGLTEEEHERLISWSVRKSEEAMYDIGGTIPHSFRETY